MTLPDKIEAADEGASFPSTARFACAPYGDNTGHEIIIGYEANSDNSWANKILINGYEVSFDAQYAEQVIQAIRFCAAAIRARDSHEI